MKNIWLLETGVIQSNGQFFWHAAEFYTSEIKIIERIDYSIDVNKGYHVQRYKELGFNLNFKYVDYQYIATDGRIADVFLRYRKVAVL